MDIHLQHYANVLALIISFSLPTIVCAQGNERLKMPPHLGLAESLEMDLSWEELRQILPNLGKSEHLIPNADNLTSASDSFTLLDVPFLIRFEFDEGKLYGWGARATSLDPKNAIALADLLLAAFEKRLGPSVREVYLPFEHDGPSNNLSTNYLWHVNAREFSLSLDLQPESGSVGFGSYHAIMIGGSYYIADPLNPLRGLLCGRLERKPYPVEIVSDPGAREKLYVLSKLHERGVTGSRPKRAHGLADFGQTLDLFGGKFTREEDSQRCLRLEWFNVEFPLTIWRQATDGTRYAEVHFCMSSLFPRGLEFEGKPIDLKVFEKWNSSVRLDPPHRLKNHKGEQGGADQHATAPELNSEGDSKPKPESEERSQ